MHKLNFTNTSAINLLILFIILLGGILGIEIGFNGSPYMIIGVSLGILYLLFAIYKPWVAIATLFLLLPLENLYTIQGNYSATLTKLMGAFLLFLTITSGAFNHIHEVFRSRKFVWILLFGMVSIISLFVSKDFHYSAIYLIRLWLFIILYFILIMMVRDVKILYIATLALLIGSAISIVSPMYFGFGRITAGRAFERYGGLWGDQNEFAAILLVTIPIAIVYIFATRKKLLKILFCIITLILLSGFALTFSRGGCIAFAFIIVVAMFKFVSGKNRGRILAIAMPSLIVFFVAFYFTIGDKYFARMETLRILQNRENVRTESSINVRYYNYFELAPKLFIEHPILGVGFRGFIAYNRYKLISHNTYLEVLTGTGLAGFIPYMLVLFYSWKELRMVEKIASKDENQLFLRHYSEALELGFMAYLIAGLFISLDINKMMWICITLATALLNISKNQLQPLNQNPYNPYQYKTQ